MNPTNHAAYLLTSKARTLTIQEAPFPTAGPNQIVIRAAAVAINPFDWILQYGASTIARHFRYPRIIGTDVAGTVVACGPGVTAFSPGDRVTGLAVGTDKRSATETANAESAFQEYVVLRADLAAHLPDAVSAAQGAAVPLGLATAACGLYMRDYLALEYPVADPATRRDTGQTLLVWGGSTSVGCNAVQLAVASGYHVVTTASPRNFAMLEGLGASAVFDYRSATVVQDLVRFIEQSGRGCAGALVIGPNATAPCMDVVAALPKPAGSPAKRVADATGPMGTGWPKTMLGMAAMVPKMVGFGVRTTIKSKVRGVEHNMIWGTDLMANEVGPMVFREFLEPALAKGSFVPMPEVLEVGKGLDKIQEAFGVSEAGVSAKKVVVTLE